ncbi:M56 family metallopeptidase [Pedobacter frigoris]|uniref:M56 family metallopeptidase n=1 Tax=Pedobacter frigoris TaxID=2571272 RepID=A0A4U1CJR5_9SPHI|nr:M56 family metallopeptidase [Pedobacter frigoris]TKC06356.1 M56 family metallopeptidase [Pedobacter frigoris]
MMNWLYYLLEANLYLAVFYGFYRLFLHKETFYTINRYYLLSATLFAFALPLLQVGYLNELLSTNSSKQFGDGGPEISKTSGNPFININQVITWSYLLIALGFLARLAYNLYGVISLATAAKKQRQGKIILVDLDNSVTAFSFFNMLFINPSIKEKNTILKHEMVHISQNHSLDILFFELIQILNWFNPITWVIQKDIKLIHEYIADDLTTVSDIPKHDYAMLLIQNSFGNVPSQLTNQIFNQSILKRRINMLNQKKSAGRARLKLLLAIPIAGGMLCASTLAFSKDYVLVDLYPEKYRTDYAMNQEPKTAKKVNVTKQEQVPPPPPKQVKVKFPPPKAKNSPKRDQVKFPPPIVKPDVVNKNEVPPPPPVEPPPPKVDQVKFPPPVVKRDQVKFTPPRPKKVEVVSNEVVYDVPPPQPKSETKKSETDIKKYDFHPTHPGNKRKGE